MLEVLHNLLVKEQADIAACNYYWIRENEDVNCKAGTDDNVIKTYRDNTHAFLFERTDLAVIACNKIFRKELFNSVTFPEGRYHEDEFVVHHILGESKCITYTEKNYTII